MKKLKEVIRPHGKWGYIRLALYPLTTLFTTPYRLIQSLWACRVLANGKLAEYNNFTPYAGMLNVCYWTLALSFFRFGRSGEYRYVGLDNLPLSRYFSHTLSSLYSYWFSSNVTVLSGMFGWWLLHLLWLTPENYFQVALVMTLLLMSTTFYANTFSTQNYNALGWWFCPMGIYGLFTQQWEITALAWLIASFGSFTVAFLGGILSVSMAMIEWSPAPVLSFLPTAIKMLTHFWPNLRQKNIRQTLLEIAKLIGFYHKDVKYKYRNKWWLSLGKSYYAMIYIQFCIAASVGGLEAQLLWVGLGVFYLNSSRLRFADDQSLQMIMLSLASAIMIQSESLWLLPFYWILASPVPFLTDFPFKKVLDVVPPVQPFHIKPILKKMEHFLKPVLGQQTIFMAFDNPKGDYGKIFFESKPHLELLRYVASQNEITVFPSWETVMNLNYEGAPEFWGRNVNDVLENIAQWRANYVLIYQEENPVLEKKWTEAGFQSIVAMDWESFNELNNEFLFPKPKWWLLKPP